MAGGILLVLVEGGDGHLEKADAAMGDAGQHRHFVLVAIPLHRQHLRDQGHRKGSQPRLGVADMKTRHQKEKPARPKIAEARTQRNIAGERAHPKHQSGALRGKSIGYFYNIFNGMRTVGIGSNNITLSYVRKPRL